MSFIDWSDPEALFDMLLEYTADEKTNAHKSKRRVQMLSRLITQLKTAQEKFSDANLPEVIHELARIIDGIEPSFQNDPVVQHLDDCLQELHRIQDERN